MSGDEDRRRGALDRLAAGIKRRPLHDRREGIDRARDTSAEPATLLRQQPGKSGVARRTAADHDALKIVEPQVALGQQPLAHLERPTHDRLEQRVQLAARERVTEAHRGAGVVAAEEGDHDRRAALAVEPYARFLGGHLELGNGDPPLGIVAPESFDRELRRDGRDEKLVDDRPVEEITAESCVAGVVSHLQDAVLERDQGGLKADAAEVVDEPARVGGGGAVGERRRQRLLKQQADGYAGFARRRDQSIALHSGETSRGSEHRSTHLAARPPARVRTQRPYDLGGKVLGFGRAVLPSEAQHLVGAELQLEPVGNVGGVVDEVIARLRTDDEALAFVAPDGCGSGVQTLAVEHDLRRAVTGDGDAAVGDAQIDAEVDGRRCHLS